jgi:hypothetical protein
MIGHYFADNGDLCQSVLALSELDGQHTGENQSQLIMKVIEEYGIASKARLMIATVKWLMIAQFMIVRLMVAMVIDGNDQRFNNQNHDNQ